VSSEHPSIALGRPFSCFPIAPDREHAAMNRERIIDEYSDNECSLHGDQELKRFPKTLRLPHPSSVLFVVAQPGIHRRFIGAR
jgi:hypothetical protein